MRSASMLFTLALFTIGFAARVNANPDTFADARAMAAELDKPLLLEFYTDW